MTDEEKKSLWSKYLHYLIEWVDLHREEANCGMSPAGFDEWNDNENEMEEE